MSKKIRCTLCNGTGKRIDDDPCLDFGGPLNYEIPCKCQFSDEPLVCVPTPPDPVAVLRGENKKLLAEIQRLRAEVERLRDGLHQISLASQNSGSSRSECGRIARKYLKEDGR